jgi:RNA polymerase sigma-70 factor (ECF subfamily)
MKDIPAELIIKASLGDNNAFKEIYQSCSGFVYSVALRIVNNATDAEEVTQEVFIKMYRNLNSFAFRSSFKTWLYRVATNCAINTYRQRAKEKNRSADFEIASSQLEASVSTQPDAPKEEAENMLNKLLSCLSADERACIILREIEGLSYKEIATALKINLNTLRTRLRRAREAILASSKRGVIRNEL